MADKVLPLPRTLRIKITSRSPAKAFGSKSTSASNIKMPKQLSLEASSDF